MKSELKATPVMPTIYPAIVEYDDSGTVVLMQSAHVGVVLHSVDCDLGIGTCHTNWATQGQHLYCGTIKLEN